MFIGEPNNNSLKGNIAYPLEVIPVIQIHKGSKMFTLNPYRLTHLERIIQHTKLL